MVVKLTALRAAAHYHQEDWWLAASSLELSATLSCGKRNCKSDVTITLAYSGLREEDCEFTQKYYTAIACESFFTITYVKVLY
jgi:hypothetical protein